MTSVDVTVEVSAQREGKWWVLRMADGVTQAKSLGDVDEMVRDYVSLMRDVPAERVRVDLVSIDPGSGMAVQVEGAKRAQEEAEQAQKVAARAIRDTAKALKQSGLAGLEVARVLGVSPQRVSQLIKKDA
ncbi:hypothetical protein [Kineosporia babensis]|uniref:Antitoxin HicB n=1 Tax=Kineosporia babensis TaxID=499548 RepID=A0A9X1SRN2_9ACTN|nr:hypothetical protein [Kineosporia babensis]MCD5309807.1 hypothetical protein [Kineosporia babensis]